MELDEALESPGWPGGRRAVGAPAARLRLPGRVAIEPLAVYERNGDGHTLSRHCATSPEVECERLERHPFLRATGSFIDAPTAQHCVQACVNHPVNRLRLAFWRHSEDPRLVLGCTMTQPIGSVLTRLAYDAGQRAPAPASGVRVVLRRDPAYRAGFAVLTAYPQLP